MAKKPVYNVSIKELELALKDRKLSKDELAKLDNTILGGIKLKNELNDFSKDDVDKSVQINLKSHGIYLQADREKKKNGIKEWTFLVRIPIWGGGDISSKEWIKISELAEKYSRDWNDNPSIRLTTRQSIQFHGVKKEGIIKLVNELIDLNRLTLNACGDNTRNPLACVHKSNLFNGTELAHEIGEYFRLSVEEHANTFSYVNLNGEIKKGKFKYSKNGLPRKFKMAISGVYKNENSGEIVNCNCTDILTNDLAIAPLIENEKLVGYQVYIGGGLGQKNGKIIFPALASPLGIFETKDELFKGLNAIVNFQQEYGDRENRHWARFKNLIVKKGLEISNKSIEDVLLNKEQFELVQSIGVNWIREKLIDDGIPLKFTKELNIGSLHKHHGFIKQIDDNYSYGFWIENGRITDYANQGKLLSFIKDLVNKYEINIRITPYQDLFFTDIKEIYLEQFKESIKEFNNQKYSVLRRNSIACVGLPSCGLSVTDSERFLNPLLSNLENRNLGNVEEVRIGISGCERHCSRNVRYDICIEGKANNLYQLKLLFGRVEENYLASDIIHNDEKYLRQIPIDNIADLIELLINNYLKNRYEEESSISQFHSRIGINGIIELIKADKNLSHLLDKKYDKYLV